jgi:hypothetical protein
LDTRIKPSAKYALSLTILAVVCIMALVVILKPGTVSNAEASGPLEQMREENPNSTVATKPLPPLSPEEHKEVIASLNKMSGILAQFTSDQKSLEDLVATLKAQKQEPFIVKDKNEYTGEMIIVRTKNPPTGTRYFHAQYFTDESKERFVQHMSFEFRPSATAMDDAIKAVHTAFPNLGSPETQNHDFIQWNLGTGQVLWLKRLGQDDIIENPFNAYSESDIGSIRIAVELELEGH